MPTTSEKPVKATKTTKTTPATPVVKTGVVYDCSVLNCRFEPSLKAAIATTLKAGDKVEIIETKDGWTKYKIGDATGWSLSEYIKED